jgi:NAD-dependent deacetylase
MIVGGTSLVVYPAAGLLRYYSGDRLIILNRDPTPFDDEAAVVLHGDIDVLLPAILPSA